MRCTVRVGRDGAGYVAACEDLPQCVGRGATRDEALARVREAILFWIETCPCDITAEAGLVLDVIPEG